MRQTLIDRFLKYVSQETRSDENSTTIPSTPSQIAFGKKLVEELKGIGLLDATIDEFGYVTATLKSNIDKKVPTIGFIAHMDTADFNATNVRPQFVENYNGEDIILNKEENVILSPTNFPELKNYIGNTLITTDGSTLLGADDKAGIAEIITAIEFLVKNPQVKHGDIKVAFTPDEEIGRGADKFNVEKFGADFAYTLDGSTLGELEYESFNAASAKVLIKGTNVHPGFAKGKMVNSISLAKEFISLFPEDETPETTEGYEGFFHLLSFHGEVDETKLSYIIRDFDKYSFENRKKFFIDTVDKMKKKYGMERFILELNDQYYNMREKVEPVIEIVDIAKTAMENCNITPNIKAIRGGTDGSKLSFMGLPTPNIFAGGENFHGRYEYIAVESMEKACNVIIEISKLFANK